MRYALIATALVASVVAAPVPEEVPEPDIVSSIGEDSNTGASTAISTGDNLNTMGVPTAEVPGVTGVATAETAATTDFTNGEFAAGTGAADSTAEILTHPLATDSNPVPTGASQGDATLGIQTVPQNTRGSPAPTGFTQSGSVNSAANDDDVDASDRGPWDLRTLYDMLDWWRKNRGALVKGENAGWNQNEDESEDSAFTRPLVKPSTVTTANGNVPTSPAGVAGLGEEDVESEPSSLWSGATDAEATTDLTGAFGADATTALTDAFGAEATTALTGATGAAATTAVTEPAATTDADATTLPTTEPNVPIESTVALNPEPSTLETAAGSATTVPAARN